MVLNTYGIMFHCLSFKNWIMIKIDAIISCMGWNWSKHKTLWRGNILHRSMMITNEKCGFPMASLSTRGIRRVGRTIRSRSTVLWHSANSTSRCWWQGWKSVWILLEQFPRFSDPGDVHLVQSTQLFGSTVASSVGLCEKHRKAVLWLFAWYCTPVQ